MKASVVDLPYKMNEVLKALDRGEQVTLIWYGKMKGTIIPVKSGQSTSVVEHPFFNMVGTEPCGVQDQMNALRKSRFNDI